MYTKFVYRKKHGIDMAHIPKLLKCYSNCKIINFKIYDYRLTKSSNFEKF